MSKSVSREGDTHFVASPFDVFYFEHWTPEIWLAVTRLQPMPWLQGCRDTSWFCSPTGNEAHHPGQCPSLYRKGGGHRPTDIHPFTGWFSEHSAGRSDMPVITHKRNHLPNKGFWIPPWDLGLLVTSPHPTLDMPPDALAGQNCTLVLPRKHVWHYCSPSLCLFQNFAGGLNELWRRKNMKLMPRNLKGKKKKLFNTTQVLSYTYHVKAGFIFIYPTPGTFSVLYVSVAMSSSLEYIFFASLCVSKFFAFFFGIFALSSSRIDVLSGL